MKVTRLKRGYTIRLNDTEFEAMTQLMAHGEAEFQGVDPHGEYGIAKRIANAMFALHMHVDEDRRGS